MENHSLARYQISNIVNPLILMRLPLMVWSFLEKLMENIERLKKMSEDVEIKVIEDIQEIKTNLALEIIEIINNYIEKYGKDDIRTIRKLGKVDVLGIIELIKLKYYNESDFEIKVKQNYKEEIGR
jgi:hypothetical protein